MEMHLNIDKLKYLRDSKAWSQSQLAEIAGLSLRTIQRIEKSGIASPESVKAICASYGIEAKDILTQENANNDIDAVAASESTLKIKPSDIKATLVAFGLAFIIAYTFL